MLKFMQFMSAVYFVASFVIISGGYLRCNESYIIFIFFLPRYFLMISTNENLWNAMSNSW